MELLSWKTPSLKLIILVYVGFQNIYVNIWYVEWLQLIVKSYLNLRNNYWGRFRILLQIGTFFQLFQHFSLKSKVNILERFPLCFSDNRVVSILDHMFISSLKLSWDLSPLFSTLDDQLEQQNVLFFAPFTPIESWIQVIDPLLSTLFSWYINGTFRSHKQHIGDLSPLSFDVFISEIQQLVSHYWSEEFILFLTPLFFVRFLFTQTSQMEQQKFCCFLGEESFQKQDVFVVLNR